MTSPEITDAMVEAAALAYAKACGKCNRRGIRSALSAALAQSAAPVQPVVRGTLADAEKTAAWLRNRIQELRIDHPEAAAERRLELAAIEAEIAERRSAQQAAPSGKPKGAWPDWGDRPDGFDGPTGAE